MIIAHTMTSGKEQQAADKEHEEQTAKVKKLQRRVTDAAAAQGRLHLVFAKKPD